MDVLTEAHRPNLLGQWLALEHPGLIVDLHAGVMALPEGPDDHDRQHGDEGQAHHHIGDEGRHRPDSTEPDDAGLFHVLHQNFLPLT